MSDTATTNEDWIKTLHWDMYRQSTLITTIPNLLWALGTDKATGPEQIASLQHFMTLPAWTTAPLQLQTEAHHFLEASKVSSSKVIAYSDDQPRDEHGRWTSDGSNEPLDEHYGNRLGKCYELAGKYFLNEYKPGDLLVHGTIQGNGNPPLDHAWVITNSGKTVWEPASNIEYPTNYYYQHFNAKDVSVYDRNQAGALMLKNEHWGPWENDATKASKVLAYSDDEARDSTGKWTSDGGNFSVKTLFDDTTRRKRLADARKVEKTETEYTNKLFATPDYDNHLGFATSPGGVKDFAARNIAGSMDQKFYPNLVSLINVLSSRVNGEKFEPASDHLTSKDMWVISKDLNDGYPIYFNPKEAALVKDAYKGEWYKGNSSEVFDGLKVAGASVLLSLWSGTSNDSSPYSLAMQSAAAKTFGLKNSPDWDTDNSESDVTYSINGKETTDLKDATSAVSAMYGPMYENFLQTQYAITQKTLADMGLSSLTLYRGFQFDKESLTPGSKPSEELPPVPSWAKPAYEGNALSDQVVNLRPLSSFSTNPDLASSFSNGVVVGGIIPASQILSIPITGLGCLDEGEAVVLGGSHTYTVLTKERVYEQG